MTITTDISLFALVANGAYNSITANATAITAISVGGTTINSTVYAGTANNANNLGGVAAASYQLNSTLAANVATLTANAAGFLGNSSGTLANVASWVTGNAATAFTNATTFASNASNITTGTLPDARLSSAVVNTSGNFTVAGNINFTAANVNFANVHVGANVDLTTTSLVIGNTTVNTVATAGQISISGATINSTIYTGTANNANNLGGSSLATIQSQITGNAATAFTNATTFASNASNITTGTLPDARLSSAVVNTTGNFTVAGNLNFTGSNNQFTNVNVTTAINVGANVVANTTVIRVGNTDVHTSINSTAVNTGLITTSGNVSIGGALTVTGNLTVNGTYVTVSGNAVVYSDNMLFLNQGVIATITNVVGNGSVVVFTANNNYQVGWDVLVSGVNPASYNGFYLNITAANSTSFSVANTNTATYVSGGTARGQTEANPDLGIAAGYNDGTYRHAGFFRDASDGVWKVFDSYLPEPDTSIFIDTSNNSFNIAPFQANVIYIGNTTVFGTANATNFTGTANNATNFGGLSLATVQGQITGNAATAYSNAVANAAALYQTTAGLSANVATLTANAAGFLGNSSGTLANIASWVTGNAATAYTNAVANAAALYQTTAGLSANVATLTANAAGFLGNSSGTLANIASWVTGNAATAFTNATTFASNASNITTGTLPDARLSSAVVNTSGNFTVAGNINFTAANVNFANVHVGANVDLTTTSLFIGNTTVNTVATAGQISISGATINSTIYTGTANNANNLGGSSLATIQSQITGNAATAFTNATTFASNASNISTGTLANARLDANVTNTSANFTITGIRTHQANIVVGNTSVNTQLSNATILISNSSSITTLGLTDLRIGNTTTNVVISNTVSTFGGNVSITGVANVTGNVTIGGSAFFVGNGNFITTINATNISTGTLPDARLSSAVVNTSGNFTVSGTRTHNANVTIGATGELIIANGAGIEANGGFGSAGQLLTSNGTGVYWSTISGVNTAAQYAWTNTHTFAANVTFDTSTLFVDATNDRVGIGNTAPDARLTVTGTANVSGNVAIGGTYRARNANYTFTLPNVGSAASWIFLGTFTAAQSGQHVYIKVVTGVGYNATAAQQSEIHIHFKTSNGSSVDGNGFAGDATFYVTNANDGSGYNVKVRGNAAGVSATSYDIFLFQAGAFNGDGSFYTVELGNQFTSSWTNSSTTTTDPGVASSTIAVGTERFLIQSNVGINTSAPDASLAVTGTANISGNVVIGGALTSANLTTTTNTVTFGTAARVVANGNVGIGNSTPGQTLTVNGDVSALFYTNPTTINANYTIPTNFNAMSIGPITVTSGVTVTIPSGSTWVIT